MKTTANPERCSVALGSAQVSTCCTCGYSWPTGKSGSHSCAGILEPRVHRLTWLLGQIIQDLPERRDWLNPDIEKEARSYLPNAKVCNEPKSGE
jgi:hypothetical protein